MSHDIFTKTSILHASSMQYAANKPIATIGKHFIFISSNLSYQNSRETENTTKQEYNRIQPNTTKHTETRERERDSMSSEREHML